MAVTKTKVAPAKATAKQAVTQTAKTANKKK